MLTLFHITKQITKEKVFLSDFKLNYKSLLSQPLHRSIVACFKKNWYKKVLLSFCVLMRPIIMEQTIEHTWREQK